jgi:hypothetical protein
MLITVGFPTSVKYWSGVLPVVCSASESPDDLAAVHTVTAANLPQNWNV